LGVGLYAVQDNQLLTYTALQLPFSVNSDSSNQNTMEFVAVILGLLLAWRLDIANFSYDLHGDNMSSLAWARSDRVNSLLARRANIIFTTVSMHLNAQLADTEHIPGSMACSEYHVRWLVSQRFAGATRPGPFVNVSGCSR
jgi:hypothetical protein